MNSLTSLIGLVCLLGADQAGPTLRGRVVDADGALEHIRQHTLRPIDGQGHVGARLERPVLVDDGRVGVDHRPHPQRLAGDDLDARMRRLRRRDLRRRHILIAR